MWRRNWELSSARIASPKLLLNESEAMPQLKCYRSHPGPAAQTHPGYCEASGEDGEGEEHTCGDGQGSRYQQASNDWKKPPPDFLEIDLVAHCGGNLSGSFVHSLVSHGHLHGMD